MSFTPKNLYPPYSSSSQNVSSWTATSGTYLGQVAYSKATAWGGISNIFYLSTGSYTFSIYIRSSISRPVSIYNFLNEGYPHYSESGTANRLSVNLGDITGDNAWHRYTFGFEVTQAGYFALRPEARSSVDTQMYIAAPQLEVGSTATDFEPYNCTWYIGLDGELHNTNFLDLPSAAMSQPYPHALWRITEGVNDGLPYNGLLSEVPYFGAFANATDLTVVRIPPSVKKIGRESFRGTQLRSVTIASDCEYYDTSFPTGCEINFYLD